jgi:hypothetical protein
MSVSGNWLNMEAAVYSRVEHWFKPSLLADLKRGRMRSLSDNKKGASDWEAPEIGEPFVGRWGMNNTASPKGPAQQPGQMGAIANGWLR